MIGSTREARQAGRRDAPIDTNSSARDPAVALTYVVITYIDGDSALSIEDFYSSFRHCSPLTFFHPIDRIAIQRFLNGDVRHRGRRRGAVPMLLVRCKPDQIAGT